MTDNSNVLLMILDGFGVSSEKKHNAIALAQKPNLDSYMNSCPHSLLEASGTAVGLPSGIMGNSEVGHLNIGGGRIIKQELTKIIEFAKTKGFENLSDMKRLLTENTGALHLLGLLSDGGVHSHEDHLFLILEAAARVDSKRPIFIHAITDGRDTPPKSALQYVSNLENAIAKTKKGKISTIQGRFYIMDRDKRWERTETGYSAITTSLPGDFTSAKNAIEDAYSKNETDEFIKPRRVKGGQSIQKEDSVLFFNFRADRARQICRALAIKDFKEFKTPVKIVPQNLVTFTRYDEKFEFPVLFQPSHYENLLGELVSKRGDKQLRIAETEKYAHVTYFFNGGEEKIFEGEDRVLVPSPKEVATYDLKPEMSARTVTHELLKKMDETSYRLIVLNFANSDMVGHTGVEPAAIKAIEVLDQCIGDIVKKATAMNYNVLITADHGNSEQMVDPKTGAPHTAHTTNPVPFIWIKPGDDSISNKQKLKDGKLADIAPTILDIFKWPKPSDMTGSSLIS